MSEKNQFEIIKFFDAKKTQDILLFRTYNNLKNMPTNSLMRIGRDYDIGSARDLLKGHVESNAYVKGGDWIDCDDKGKKHVIKSIDFNKLYNVVGATAISKDVKSFVEIKTGTKAVEWENSLGEKQSIPNNTRCLLMANSEKELLNSFLKIGDGKCILDHECAKSINKMDKNVFAKTYTIIPSQPKPLEIELERTLLIIDGARPKEIDKVILPEIKISSPSKSNYPDMDF